MRTKNNRLVLTGGGTAGHVIGHIALLDLFRKHSWDLLYIGSSGIEKKLIEIEGVEFKSIKVGKLRRYFSFENFIDVFKIIFGTVQSIFYLIKFQPAAVFSKGGFVSVPVAVAAWLLKIPILTHESDYSPGLATKIIQHIAHTVFYSFPETEKYLDSEKAIFSGSPVRLDLHKGNRIKGLELCEFPLAPNKPILLVMGGSLGAVKVNSVLNEALPVLVESYFVIHLTGSGKKIDFTHENYRGFSFLNSELRDVLACADLVVSRAGANAIFELLALAKPMLLIPLEAGSRGDQPLNASSFEKENWAMVIREKSLNPETLVAKIDELYATKERMQEYQKKYHKFGTSAHDTICSQIAKKMV